MIKTKNGGILNPSILKFRIVGGKRRKTRVLRAIVNG